MLFDFTNSSGVTSPECSENKTTVQFKNEDRQQTITMTFDKMGGNYALTKVDLMVTILNTTFENAQGMVTISGGTILDTFVSVMFCLFWC